MKNIKVRLFIIAILSFSLSLNVHSINTGTVEVGKIDQAPDSVPELSKIAEEAYLYGFPMLYAYKVMYDFNIDETSAQYKAPFNTLSGEVRVFTPKDTSAAAPNSDTPYAFCQFDLRSEPMVIHVPEIEEGRFFNIQLIDMYSDNYGYIGSRATGNKKADYLVVGPGWDGKVPKGIKKVFYCETQFGIGIFRSQLFGKDDLPNVKKIQEGFSVKPLSEYLGKPAPPAPEKVEWLPFKKSAFTTHFGQYMNFLLQFCPPIGTASVEKPLRENFAKIGIVAGAEWDPSKISPEQKQAISQGMKAAFAKINHEAKNLGSIINGWQIGTAQGNRDYYNGNWTLRAVAAKLGIYGNNAEEATYPMARNDINGQTLDGSEHTYTVTFEKGQLPPVNAFWSLTMYDAYNSFLVENSIDRYLINSAMVPNLKKNADGSITLYIQRDHPGADREANWLPAPDGPMLLVMRLYWPKTGELSVLPAGEGTWAPPAVIPVSNLRAERVRRIGDKSQEIVIRTDDRYGHDPVIFGPRGWGYSNFLENPRSIQNPNLWPEQQSTYFMSKFKMPKGSSITFKGRYPQARYFKFALYRWDGVTFLSIGQDLPAKYIEPDPGSVNPFRVGAYRLGENRDYTIKLVALELPEDPKDREQNTMYVGESGDLIQMFIRLYLSDQGMDGTGLGPADRPFDGQGFPAYTGELADGTKLSAKEVAEQFSIPFEQNMKPPVTEQQWVDLVNSKNNDPTLDPKTAPARPEPRWEKYWNFKYSIIGAFLKPEDRAKIPYAGVIDGGADPATQYLFVFLSRQFGNVYVMRGKMPTFPDTYSGPTGRGLEIMPSAQTQYWSIVTCESAPTGKISDGLADMQVPLDADRNYTIVVSRKEDRPINATEENGVVWVDWGDLGEGMAHKANRTDWGMLIMRIMTNYPDWKERPDNITAPGMEEEVMGAYYPKGEYMSKDEFEKLDLSKRK